MLRFVDRNERDALRVFLVAKLERLKKSVRYWSDLCPLREVNGPTHPRPCVSRFRTRLSA